MQDYIEQKRQQQEELLANEKRLKDEQERGRKEKIKRLNEPIKDASNQYLPASFPKRTSAFTPVCSFFIEMIGGVFCLQLFRSRREILRNKLVNDFFVYLDHRLIIHWNNHHDEKDRLRLHPHHPHRPLSQSLKFNLHDRMLGFSPHHHRSSSLI